uniref:TORC_N domain-containing protein n=1 Tax=Angiostrongylus cantonensis TaxID=6313 RepID=A0A158PB46_ANGCA
MSSTSPRKFAEKIAIMNRKQSEDMSTFDSIMREVRQITSSSETQTTSQPSTSLCPPQWNPISGSLPNVHQMPSYHTDWGASWIPTTQNAHRSRSSEQHPILYHPYGRGQRSPDRVPPLGPHYVPYPNPQYQLLAPEQWNHSYHFQKGTELTEGFAMVIFLKEAELHWKKIPIPLDYEDATFFYEIVTAGPIIIENTSINRARSDPGIHEVHAVQGNGEPSMLQHQFQAGPSGLNQMMPFGPPGSIPNNMVSSQPGMVLPVQTMVGAPLQSSHPSDVQGVSMQSPLQSPLGYHMQNYGFPNGSPMQSPMGSPISSSMILEERTTPAMELSPPSASDPCNELREHFYEEILPT